MDIYKRIKKLRIELNMSQEELAKKTGYTDRTSISKIESGRVDLTHSKVIEFAKALKVTPSYLMGWEEEKETPTSTDIEDLTDKELVAYSIARCKKDSTEADKKMLDLIQKQFDLIFEKKDSE